MARWRDGNFGRSRTRRGNPAWGPRLALLFFGLAFLLTVALWLVDFLLRDPIEAWAESKAVNMATQAIALALSEGITPQMDESALAEPIVDTDGRVIGFHYAMGEINRLEAETALWIQRQLQRLSLHSLPMPLGQLTGLHWMAGLGPAIPIRMLPIGHVRTSPRSEFRAAGINQVLHRIYVDVELKMRVVAPFLQTDIPVQQAVVLTERVMIGDVPQFFVQWGDGSLRDLPTGMLLSPGASAPPPAPPG